MTVQRVFPPRHADNTSVSMSAIDRGRKAVRKAGVVFIVATVAGIVAVVLFIYGVHVLVVA